MTTTQTFTPEDIKLLQDRLLKDSIAPIYSDTDLPGCDPDSWPTWPAEEPEEDEPGFGDGEWPE